MKCSQLCTLTVFAAMLCIGSSAIADKPKGKTETINFQELSTGYVYCPTCDRTGDLAGVGTTYSSQGYTFSYTPAVGEPYPTSLCVVGPFWPYNNGTNALFANSVNAVTHLARDDGRPFKLSAIDLAETNGPGSVPTTVMFQGMTVAGQLISQKLVLDNIRGFQRFHFPNSFNNLVYVDWQQGDAATNGIHMFDNIQLIATEVRPPR